MRQRLAGQGAVETKIGPRIVIPYAFGDIHSRGCQAKFPYVNWIRKNSKPARSVCAWHLRTAVAPAAVKRARGARWQKYQWRRIPSTRTTEPRYCRILHDRQQRKVSVV